MAFAAQFSLLDIVVPVIGYIHTSGFDQAYASREKKSGSVSAAIKHTRNLVRGNSDILGEYGSLLDYLIVALWGDEEEKVVEAFGYEHVEPGQWSGNPERYSWVFRNGLQVATRDRGRSCLEIDAILGAEANHRLLYTKTLDEFLHSRPYLFDLEPAVRVKE